MKFSHLIEHNMGNSFIQKPCTKCCGKTIPRPLPKKVKIEHTSGSAVQSFLQFVFIVCQIEECRKIY